MLALIGFSDATLCLKMSDLNVRQTAIVSVWNFNVWRELIISLKHNYPQSQNKDDSINRQYKYLIEYLSPDRSRSNPNSLIIRERLSFINKIIHHHVSPGLLSSTFLNSFFHSILSCLTFLCKRFSIKELNVLKNISFLK